MASWMPEEEPLFAQLNRQLLEMQDQVTLINAQRSRAASPQQASRKHCGARTRRGTSCLRKARKNGRCPNHGGMSTGPKTPQGRERIAAVQRRRWAAWREKQI
jgi:hypothetical protein